MIALRKTRSLKGTNLADVFARVYARRGLQALAQSQSILGLNKAETGRLFGITRQAVDDWYKKGVPMNRLADVERVADMARALHTRFIPQRVPQIAREPLPGLNDQSILESVRTNGPASVMEMLDRAFSYVPR